MMNKPCSGVWGRMLGKTSAAAAAVATALGLWAGIFAPSAAALPGQCWSSPFGGFCDTTPLSDGSFQHCITYGTSSFCTQACHNYATGQAEPTDLDPNTPC